MASMSEEQQCSEDEEEVQVIFEEDSTDSMPDVNGSSTYFQTEEGATDVFIISTSELENSTNLETEETPENVTSDFDYDEQLSPMPDKIIELITVPTSDNENIRTFSTNRSEGCGVRLVRGNLPPPIKVPNTPISPIKVPCTPISQLPHIYSIRNASTSSVGSKLRTTPSLSYSVISNNSGQPKNSEAESNASFFCEDEQPSDYDSEHATSFHVSPTYKTSFSNKSPRHNIIKVTRSRSTFPKHRGLKLPSVELPTSVTTISVTGDNSPTIDPKHFDFGRTDNTIIIPNSYTGKNQSYQNVSSVLEVSVTGASPLVRSENTNIQTSKHHVISEQDIRIPEHSSIFHRGYVERNNDNETRKPDYLHEMKSELFSDDEASHSSDIFTDDCNFHFVSCDGGENLPFQSTVRISTDLPKNKHALDNQPIYVKQIIQSSSMSKLSKNSESYVKGQRFALPKEDANYFSPHNELFTRGSQKRRRMLSSFSSFWHKSLEEQGLVRCPLRSCNYISLKFADMCNHYAFCTGDPNGRNMCSVCCYRLGTPEDLDIHMKISHNNDHTLKKSSTSSNIKATPTTFEQLVEAPLTRKRSYSKVHVTSWQIALSRDGYVKCFFRNCNYLAMSVEEMIDHYRICKGDVCVVHDNRSSSNINLPEDSAISNIVNIVDNPSVKSSDVTIKPNDKVDTGEDNLTQIISETFVRDQDPGNDVQYSTACPEDTKKFSNISTVSLESTGNEIPNKITCLPDTTGTKCILSSPSKSLKPESSNDQCESIKAFLEAASNELCDTLKNSSVLLESQTNITQPQGRIDSNVPQSPFNSEDTAALESENHVSSKLSQQHHICDLSKEQGNQKVPCSFETTAVDKTAKSFSSQNNTVPLEKNNILNKKQQSALCISHMSSETCDKNVSTTSENVNVAESEKHEFSSEDDLCSKERKITDMETNTNKAHSKKSINSGNLTLQTTGSSNDTQFVEEDTKTVKIDANKFEKNKPESDSPESNVKRYANHSPIKEKLNNSELADNKNDQFDDPISHNSEVASHDTGYSDNTEQIQNTEHNYDIEQSPGDFLDRKKSSSEHTESNEVSKNNFSVGKSEAVSSEQHFIDQSRHKIMKLQLHSENKLTDDYTETTGVILKEKISETTSMKRKANENGSNQNKEEKSEIGITVGQLDFCETDEPDRKCFRSSSSDHVIDNENKDEIERTSLKASISNNNMNLDKDNDVPSTGDFDTDTRDHIHKAMEIGPNDVESMHDSRVLKSTSNYKICEIGSSDCSTFSEMKVMHCRETCTGPDERVGVIITTKSDNKRNDEMTVETTETDFNEAIETNSQMLSGNVDFQNVTTVDPEYKPTDHKDIVNIAPNISVTEKDSNIEAVAISDRKNIEASSDTRLVYNSKAAEKLIAKSDIKEKNKISDNQHSDIKLTIETDQKVDNTKFQENNMEDLSVNAGDTVSRLKKKLTYKMVNYPKNSLAIEVPVKVVEGNSLQADMHAKKSYADVVKKTSKQTVGIDCDRDLKVTKEVHFDKKVYHNAKRLNACVNNNVNREMENKDTCLPETEKTKCVTSTHMQDDSVSYKREPDSCGSTGKSISDSFCKKRISHLKSANIGVTTIIDKDFEDPVESIKVTDYKVQESSNMVSSLEDTAHNVQVIQLGTDKELNIATYGKKINGSKIEVSVEANEIGCNETYTADRDMSSNTLNTVQSTNNTNSNEVETLSEKAQEFVEQGHEVVAGRNSLYLSENINDNIIKLPPAECNIAVYELRESLNSHRNSNPNSHLRNNKNSIENYKLDVSNEKEKRYTSSGVKLPTVEKSIKFKVNSDTKAEECDSDSSDYDEKGAISNDDSNIGYKDNMLPCDSEVIRVNNRFSKSKKNSKQNSVVAETENENHQKKSEICKTDSSSHVNSLILPEKRKCPSEFVDKDSKVSKKGKHNDDTNDCLNVEICRLQSDPAKCRGRRKANQVLNGCSQGIIDNSKSSFQIIDSATPIIKRKRGRPRKIRPEEELTPDLKKADLFKQTCISDCRENSVSPSAETYTRSRRKVKKKHDPDFVETNYSSELKLESKTKIDELPTDSVTKESECDDSSGTGQYLRKRKKGVIYSFDNTDSMSDDDYKVLDSAMKESQNERGDFGQDKGKGRGRGRGRGRPPKLRGRGFKRGIYRNREDNKNDIVSNDKNKDYEIRSEQFHSDIVNNSKEKVESEKSLEDNFNASVVENCSISSENIAKQNKTFTAPGDTDKNVTVKPKRTKRYIAKGNIKKSKVKGNAKSLICTAFVKYESLSKADGNTQVCCALCGTKMKKKEFYNHSIVKHVGMAHIDGDQPINTDDKRLVFSILTRIIKKRKSITCVKCGDMKRSTEGYLSHLEQCQKSEEEIEKLKVQCNICLRTMLPSSFKVHMATHAQRKAEVVDIELDAPKGTRAAAARAINKLQDFIKDEAQEGDITSGKRRSTSPNPGMGNTYIESDNEVSKSMLSTWKRYITMYKVAKCRNIGCTFSSGNLDELSKHHSSCEFLLKKGFHCLMCTFFSDTEQQIISHVNEKHGTEESDGDSCESDITCKSKQHSVLTPGFKKFRVYSKVDFLVKDYNQPTRGNQPYLPALRWTLEFHQKNYSTYLFPDHHTQLSDWLFLNATEVLEYLPACPASVPVSAKVFKNAKEHSKNNTDLEWKQFKLFESTVINGVPTFFAGGPVWAMAWCTIPLSVIFKSPIGETESQFLAVSCHKNMSDVFDIGCAYKDTGLIQIWDFGVLNNIRSCNTPPKFVLGIAHNYGTVWCLEWCPSGCYNTEESDENKLKRLGLLAAACSDGTVRIFSVCFPSQLPMNSQERPVFKTEAAVTLVLDSDESIASTTRNFQCTRISWFKGKNHKIIAAGFTNGIVALWNLDTQSPLLRRVVGRFHTLTPYFMFQPHLSIISALSLSPHGEGHYLMTGSFDRCTKLWNLEDVSVPLTSFRKGAITDGLWLPHWVSAVSSYEDSYSLSHSNVSLFPARQFGCPPYPLLAQNSSVWSLSSCDWLNGIAQGTLAGELCVIFSHQLLLSVDVEKGMKDKRVMISFVELKDFKKEDTDSKNENSSSKNGLDEVEKTSATAVSGVTCKNENRCMETIEESRENSMSVTFDESFSLRDEDSKSVMSYDIDSSEDSLDSSNKLVTPSSPLSENSNEVDLITPKRIFTLNKDSDNVSCHNDSSHIGEILGSSNFPTIQEGKCHKKFKAFSVTDSCNENKCSNPAPVSVDKNIKTSSKTVKTVNQKDLSNYEKQENTEEVRNQNENIEVIYFTDIKNPTDIGLREKKKIAKTKERIFREKGLSVFEQNDGSAQLSVQLNTYGAVAERYGMRFCDFPLESFDNMPEESRLWMRQSDQMRVFPSEIYPLVSINKVSWNPNCYSFLWLAAGCHNGFVRVPCVRSMHTPAVENFLLNAATEFNAELKDKLS